MTATAAREFSPPDLGDEYPFASHYLEISGQRYHYIDEGEGEVLLCVHGNPTWSFAWRNVIKSLSPHYRVIAVDHVGCGWSSKPQNYDFTLDRHIRNLTEFIEAKNLNRITLVAHDWGGAIGMGAAVRLKERFSRFALMNTAAFRSKQIPLRIAACRFPGLGTLGVRGFNLFARAAITMAVENSERMTPAVRQGYLAPYDSWANRVAVLRFVQDIPLRPSHPSYQTLVEVESGLESFQNHPMQLIWGMRDWCFTPAFLEEFQRRFPNAETLTFPNAGHYVFEDAREELPAAMQDFLAKHP